MDDHSINMHIKSLCRALTNIHTILAWLDLKESERRLGDPSALVMAQGLVADLRNEQSRFAAIATEILDALNATTADEASEIQYTQWRNEVMRLIAEMQRLPIPKGL